MYFPNKLGLVVKVGDLVTWAQSGCDSPGLVLETRPAKRLGSSTPGHSWNGRGTMTAIGLAILVMLPELNNDPEWFHERELDVVK